MERKLATVLFVDLVDSTRLVTGSDPEVVRRRVSRFFERVAHCVTVHGGIVEKFAGDAVLAAFGIAQAHEDDAERAACAALAMRDEVEQLGLECRIGLEAGELVVDESEPSFATGEAVNLAARLQQAAKPGEILAGPTAYRLFAGRLVVEDAGPLELKGIAEPLRAWRVVAASERPARSSLRAPLVGRGTELELLENTFQRTLRDRRAHLFTIYGEPGVGKSRLAREFIDAVEGASVLMGRCLPYGESITYWPLAEMIKAAAGISDDDPLEEAFDKLRACCEDEAVADLLGLASGLLEALQGGRSGEEIAWAARELMEQLGDVQPLILLFEDIHWAEEPLLDLIEHLADWVRAPLLILCLARPELLDVRAGWGGGRVRFNAIELESLSEQESQELVDALLAEIDGLPATLPRELLAKTEGNPLFVEETIRMLAESDGDVAAGRIPDTLQALIAARIDRLTVPEKMLLQRAAVVGRIFWKGALAHLAPDVDELDAHLDDLLQRDFLLKEPRSSISGETAYRFKHVLIREVAYSGLAKHARAQHHARFAEWLAARAGEELLEIRAYHLDQAASLLTELDGAPPAELARETAEALAAAGKRAIARESFRSARRLLVRSLELEPTLGRRYLAARAARQVGDLAAMAIEMERVREEAQTEGNRLLEARALTALAEAALRQASDDAGAERLVREATSLLEEETDADAHFDALLVRVAIGSARGDLADVIVHLEQAFAVALTAGRKDLQTTAAQGLAQSHIVRLELDQAEPLIARALELAEESGSVRILASARNTLGWLHEVRGELDEAAEVMEQVRAMFAEIGYQPGLAHALDRQAGVLRQKGELKAAEKALRESIRILGAIGERGHLCEGKATLALLLVAQGKIEEGETVALDAQELMGGGETISRVAAPLALGAVRAAQGRTEEAEGLLRESLAGAEQTDFLLIQRDPLEQLAKFLHEEGRAEEAAPYEDRLAELFPARRTARIA